MRRTTTLVIALSMAVSGLSLLPAAPAVAAGALSTAHPTLVSADPADWTPNIQDGQVNAIVQVGNQVIVGGQFLQAKNIGGNLLDVSSILAFDATTGTINKNFMPTFDGEILALGTDGTSVYVGGRFATVNGQTGYKRLVKLDPANGQIVTPFKAKIGAGEAVHDMSFANGKLYIGGAFSAVQGVAREKFAALNPVSGVLDPTVDVAFTGKHNGGTGRIRKFDITPDGTKMVAVGNFTLVDGQDRDQAAMVDLTTDTVANWQTNRFKSACSSFFDTYTNDVDISPDGSYFVIGTTGAFMGGANAGVLCDTTSRWEINATGTALQPTWVDYTGGDTTFSVTATNTAVYVGGHQRWWNNPYSSERRLRRPRRDRPHGHRLARSAERPALQLEPDPRPPRPGRPDDARHPRGPVGGLGHLGHRRRVPRQDRLHAAGRRRFGAGPVRGDAAQRPLHRCRRAAA